MPYVLILHPMTGRPEREVTALLKDWSGGDRGALERLIPLVYGELRKLAASYLRAERPDHTLQPTALVHEAYLRLVDQKSVVWQNRAHFFGIAAQMMRRILVDHARRRQAAKRDAAGYRIPLPGEVEATGRDPELLALDGALSGLADLDPRQARIVELRFFGGLTVEETAEVAGISPATVKREWQTARAWLRREIRPAAS
jgi:RNA polymerase sigma factor (TIGR02999 family)